MSKIKKYEIWGAILTIIIGSLLHFVFDWSGGNKFVAIFGAVNESTWEHLKLAFWPAFFYMFFEYFAFGRKAKNFCLAQAVKLISTPLVIIFLFYGWSILFEDSLIYDIATFVFAVVIGHLLSFRLMTKTKEHKEQVAAGLIITLLLIMFVTYTFCPPRIFLFHDPVGGGYGIEK